MYTYIYIHVSIITWAYNMANIFNHKFELSLA